MENKNLNPVVITKEDGTKYTLEFNRRAVMFAESKGFDISQIGEGKIMSTTSDIFYFAFRMHHPNMTKEQTDRILFEEMGGIPQNVLERLCLLYAETYNTLIQNDDAEKNSKWAVEM